MDVLTVHSICIFDLTDSLSGAVRSTKGSVEMESTEQNKIQRIAISSGQRREAVSRDPCVMTVITNYSYPKHLHAFDC